MKKLNIAAKIWLSVGVFIAGFVITTVLGQLQGVHTEHNLRSTSEELFPAAQMSQEAEAAFSQAVKGFSDAVLTQDASALTHAADEGRKAANNLKSISAIKGLSSERSEAAGRLSAKIDSFIKDAQTTYSAMLSGGAAMSADTQAKMAGLADTTNNIKGALKTIKERCSQDLRDNLSKAQASSSQQRWIALFVFFISVALAAVIVNVTIRRSITGPIEHVIYGVQGAVNTAADASSGMVESGQKVARDAQEQASCIEETSASLEEISATTRENAKRASDADRLMREATDTVGRATQAMDQLQGSMHAISRSSKEVAEVLKSINEIAFHTNILALNAAVEAARAGEAGAGFSVVADEVRSLAQRAATAANNSAVIVEKTISDVAAGVGFVSLAHKAFGEVSSKIATGTNVVSEIAVSSNEQARGIGQIGQAIERISSVTESNVAHAQQTADSAQSVIQQVEATREHLQELISVVGM